MLPQPGCYLRRSKTNRCVISIRTSGVLPPQRSLAGWRIGGETKGFNAPESHNLGVACCSTYFFNSSTVTPPQEATK